MAKKKEVKRETYSIRINPDTMKKVKYFALDHDKSIGQVIEEALTAYMETYGKK